MSRRVYLFLLTSLSVNLVFSQEWIISAGGGYQMHSSLDKRFSSSVTQGRGSFGMISLLRKTARGNQEIHVTGFRANGYVNNIHDEPVSHDAITITGAQQWTVFPHSEKDLRWDIGIAGAFIHSERTYENFLNNNKTFENIVAFGPATKFQYLPSFSSRVSLEMRSHFNVAGAIEQPAVYNGSGDNNKSNWVFTSVGKFFRWENRVSVDFRFSNHHSAGLYYRYDFYYVESGKPIRNSFNQFAIMYSFHL